MGHSMVFVMSVRSSASSSVVISTFRAASPTLQPKALEALLASMSESQVEGRRG